MHLKQYCLRFYFDDVSLVFDKIYQTLKTIFDHISEHLVVRQKLFHDASYFQHSSRCLEKWSNTFFRVEYITLNFSTWKLCTNKRNTFVGSKLDFSISLKSGNNEDLVQLFCPSFPLAYPRQSSSTYPVH